MFEDKGSRQQGELFQGSLFGEATPASIPARPAKRGRAKTAKALPKFDAQQRLAVDTMADALDSKDTLRPGEQGVEKEADPRSGQGRPAVRVEACAGSGKSSCIMGAIGEMSRVSGLLLATHGKKIQLDMEKRVAKYHPDTVINGVSRIDTSTINSLGYRLLSRELAFGGGRGGNGEAEKPRPGQVVATGKLLLDYTTAGRPEGRLNKYRDIADDVAQLPSLAEVLGRDDRNNVLVSGLLKLFTFCRVRLLREPTPEDIQALAVELGLHFHDPEEPDEPTGKPFRDKWERLAAAVNEIIQQGMQLTPVRYTCKDGHIDEYAGLIDGTDQMWLPYLMGSKAPAQWKYRAVVIDEYQDLNPLQLWVVERYMHPDTPIVFVGDRRQAIFGFLGAGRQTFGVIEDRYDCEVVHLTDSYRCPDSHLALARHFHPTVKRAAALGPDGPGTTPRLIDGETMLDNLVGGDVVLGRSTAALVKAGLDYVLRYGIDPKTGKPNGCRISVPDLTGQLNTLIEEVSRLWRENTGAKRLNFQRDFREALTIARSLCPPGGEDGFNLLDVLYEFAHDRPQGRTAREFCNYAASICDSKNDTVSPRLVNFKTVHGFKGMEAPRVYIVALGLTGEFWEKKLSREQIEEEENLSYVSLTRSTRELYLVTDYHASMQGIGELMLKPVPRPAG